MAYKPFGPGYSTGAETGDSPGNNTDNNRPAEHVSNVPRRPNSQSGNLSGVKATMNNAVKDAAQHYLENPTGSSYVDDAGDD